MPARREQHLLADFEVFLHQFGRFDSFVGDNASVLLASLVAGLAYSASAEGAELKLEKADVPAFPGAEGEGAWTKGGRGGKVYIVTNLNEAGPGSFREACEADGPRTVLFGVAGIIAITKPITISHPYLTIAGQTAPGDGICIKGHTTEVNTHDVIIRYMRFRRGNLKSKDDCLGGNPVGNVIVDHVSCSWGLDENLSMYRYIFKDASGKDLKLGTENLTIQWCVSSEALDLNNHAFGGTWGGNKCSFHHNLFASNTGAILASATAARWSAAAMQKPSRRFWNNLGRAAVRAKPGMA